MLIYISIILTIHTLIGLYSVITSRIEQKRHRKMILGEIEERNKFFDELEKKLMENKVEEEMSDLLKLNNIMQRSGDIKTFPLSSNMKSAKYDKGPWGEVTIAIDSESIERLWDNDAIGVLYIVGRDEWKKENEVIPIERWTGDEREIICPTCKNYICYPEDIETIDLKYKQFCGACGQKLNWESEGEEE